MYRIDDPSASTTLPTPEAANTEGYWTEGNPATGVPATLERASWFNMVQEELRAIVVAAGLTPSKTTYNQVLAAIKRIGQNTVVLADTGAANAYTAVNATPLVAGTWVDGVVQAVKIAHTNTGASTYAPDGLTAIPIYGLGLQPLQGGELLLNGTAILMHMTIAGVNSGNPIAVLMECAGGAQQVPPATQPLHAPQFGQTHGRYLGTQGPFTSSGTYTPGSYTIDGQTITATKGVFYGTPPGGAGGGTPATGSGQASAGGGGAAGAPFRFTLTPLAAMSFTMGAPGAGAAGAAGGSGGNLVIGSIATITGGAGGGAGGILGSFPGITSGGGAPRNSTIAGTGVSGIQNLYGQGGLPGFALSTGVTINGNGGTNPYGSSGNQSNAPAGYGVGGQGAGAGQSAAAQSGIAGGVGVFWVDEYY